MEVEVEVKFIVIDNRTGLVADVEKICAEEWVQRLLCDIEGWALTEEGGLILFDACGNLTHCPPNRFSLYFA